MKRILIILFVSFFILHSCKKDNVIVDDNNIIHENQGHKIKITKNSELYRVYKYSDSKMIYFKDYSDSEFKIWIFNYNSLDKINEINEYNDNYEKLMRYKFEYKNNGNISKILFYKYINAEESFREEKKFIYDDESRLIKIEAYLPETFEYEGLNIMKHGKVIMGWKGGWVDFEYSYDENNNVLAKIGMPPISEIYISENNINKVVYNWIEMIDNMGDTTKESIIKHKDLLYTSVYKYNDNGNPILEYRQYSDHLDIFEYFYE